MQPTQHPNPEHQQQMIFMNSEMAMMAAQHGHPGLPLPPHIQPRPVSLFYIYYIIF